MSSMNRLSALFSLLIVVGGAARASALGKTVATAEPTVDTPLPAPGMGWNTFNFFGARHSDILMRKMADAFVASGLRDAGYTIIRIDGGWWGNDSDRRWYYWTEAGKYAGGQPYQPGDPHVDEKNYPGGVRPLANYLHSKRLKLGFYLSPELSTGASDNYPHNNRDHKVPPPVTGPALVDHHAHWVAESGIDHLFYDGYDWNESKGVEPYTRMFHGLREEAKRLDHPIVFSVNSGWKARARDWADEWRTGPDINGEWRSIMENLAAVSDPKPAGQGRWNNPDCLMVGFIGDEEAKSQMSLWCVTAAPLYLSWDFRVMNDWERYVLLNTEAISVDQDPAGTPGRRIKSDGDAEIWARPLSDGSHAIVLLNAGEKPSSIEVKWADLGLAGAKAQVRDLWAHESLGVRNDGYMAKRLPPHGCALLRVAPESKPFSHPANTWAPKPSKTHREPLNASGWTITTTMPRKDDPLSHLLDCDPKTGFWSYASAGQYIQLDFGRPTTFDRVIIDHKGVGPNPWPYKVYASRAVFSLQVSMDGQEFRPVASDSFGPAYTLASFKPVTARHLRIVVKEIERTSADDDYTFRAQDLYVFSPVQANQ